MSAVMGFEAQLGMGSDSPVTEAYEFLRETLAADEEFVDSGGLRGTRSHAKESVRQGVRRMGGLIVMRPTPVQLANLLPRILGAAAAGTTYALAESLPEFVVAVDRVARVFTYTGCKVDRAMFRSQAGEPLQLTLELLARDESVGLAGSFPSLSLDVTTSFFMFHDLELTVGGVSYPAQKLELIVDNHLERDRFLNSAIRSSLPESDRTVRVNLELPYGDAAALSAGGVAGAAVSAGFTNGNTSLTFTLPAVQFPRRTPTVAGRDEIRLPLAGLARKSGSTAELTVTLDATP